MQRPGGSVSGHLGSGGIHRSLDGFGVKCPEMDIARHVISSRHHPRKRVIQYSRAAAMESRSRGVLDTPLSRVMTAYAPLAFRGFWPQIKHGEMGGGRATRQPGQVRKEAALTRSGSGRSSVSYLFFSSEPRKKGSFGLRSIRLGAYSAKVGFGFASQSDWRTMRVLICGGMRAS